MSRQYPNIWQLERLVEHVNTNEDSYPGKSIHGTIRWFPARMLGYASLSQRIRAAWLVFTGRADAVVWPEAQS